MCNEREREREREFRKIEKYEINSVNKEMIMMILFDHGLMIVIITVKIILK